MSDMPVSEDYIELAADIVSAYVSNNSVPAGDLPSLINDVHAALRRVTTGGAPVVPAEALNSNAVCHTPDSTKVSFLLTMYCIPVASTE